MHNFQQYVSIFDFLTCALRAQVNIFLKKKRKERKNAENKID